MKIWNTSIGNATEIAASMPHWYARTTVIDLKRATLEDGSLDFSKASTQFVEGDKVMFIPCNDFDNVLVDSKGLVFTVATVSPSMHYTFEKGSVGKKVYSLLSNSCTTSISLQVLKLRWFLSLLK